MTSPRRFSSRGPSPHVLSVVLAGGEGRRLLPLTAERAKPAVPFGGRYRIIDFVLSNFVNSGLFKIKVLTQYKSGLAQDPHRARLAPLARCCNFIETVPAQQRPSKEWFRGSADAMFQTLNIITDEEPDLVAVFGGDHIYKMDVNQMLDFHLDRDADVTVAAIPVPVAEARAFGVLNIADDGGIHSFDEKPAQPRAMPGPPRLGAGVDGQLHLLDTAARRSRWAPTARWSRAHDFGRNVLPAMVGSGRRVYAYDFSQNSIPGEHRARARLLARRRHHRRLLPGQHGSRRRSTRCSTSTTCAGRSAPIRRRSAGEVRVRRDASASAWRPTRSSPRAASSPAGASTAACSRKACASTASPTSRRRSSWTASTSAGTRGSAAPSSTRACTSPPAPRSATTTTKIAAAASPSPKRASSSSRRRPT